MKVASHPAPLFPSPMPNVDLCLLPSLLGRSGASMAASGASMVGSVLPRLWPPSWVKSRLRSVAELQGGHTQVSRGGLGHGSALKLDQCRPNLRAICMFLFFLFFHFYWFASVVICSLYADNTDFSSCLQVCIRSEVSHASMHTIDKFPAHPRMPACHHD